MILFCQTTYDSPQPSRLRSLRRIRSDAAAIARGDCYRLVAIEQPHGFQCVERQSLKICDNVRSLRLVVYAKADRHLATAQLLNCEVLGGWNIVHISY